MLRTSPVRHRSTGFLAVIAVLAALLATGPTAPSFAAAPWDQLGTDLDGDAGNDRAGQSVALSSDGTRMAVGATRGGVSGGNTGYVRIFEWSGTAWVQLGSDLEGEGTESGYSVALSADGSRVAFGARLNSGNGTFAGHVQVYDWNGTDWSQAGSDVDGQAQFEQVGYAVALSDDGDDLIVGGVGAASNTGVARVYTWDGSDWAQVGSDIAGEAGGDISGWSVGLSANGNRVAIGAPGNDGGGSNAGQVRVFDLSGSSWVQVGDDIDGEAADDFSGRSVALSADGARLAVGAPKNDGHDTEAGHVRVFQWSGSSWVQLGADIDGAAGGDQAGASVSLSENGTRVAIGSPGAGAGEVRVFQWSGSAWVQVGSDIDGETDGDFFGFSLALSADGTAFATGATSNDANGASAGHARVHGAVTATPVPGAPTGVLVTAGDAEVAVSWSAPADVGGSPITGYTATASPGGANCSTTGATSCTVGGLTNGTAYSFTVTATNSDGTGSPSDGSVWVTPAAAPDAPSSVFGTAGDEAATITWLAPESDGGSAITAYTVTATPGGSTCATAGTLTCIVPNLTNGTAYTFDVVATNTVGTGPASTASAPVTPLPVPDAPTSVSATAGNGQATVSWAAPADAGGAAITAYTATASPGGARCSTTGATSCTVIGLTNGTGHTFTVTATNAIGTGPASTPSTAVTPVGVPDAPTQVTATAGDTTADIGWTAPTSDGGSDLTGYTATASPGGASCSTDGAVTCTVAGLTNDTVYTFSVTATNAIGTGPGSTPSDPVTPTGPDPADDPDDPDPPSVDPDDISITPDNDSATISWEAPDDPGGAIDGYTVTASPGGANCTTDGELTCTVTGLVNGTTYEFTVVVVVDGEAGAPSSATGTLPPAEDPDADDGSGSTTAIGDGGGATQGDVVATTPPCPSPLLPFTDVATVISTADVACIYGLGITAGTSPTTYSPDDPVDRDQMASFLARLWRAADLDCPATTAGFSDLATTISPADVSCIWGLGITAGTSPTTYSPDDPVDRDQMASFLARLWRATGRACPTPLLPFTDVATVISTADVACIYGLGITAGTSPTTYSPDDPVDRDQMASFLARLWRALGASDELSP
ncbi:MAG: fibronectin type III domain-containing protein [Actinomycetota bacterium]